MRSKTATRARKPSMRFQQRVSESTTTVGSCPRALATAALAAVVFSAACGGDGTQGATGAAGSSTVPPAGAGQSSTTPGAGAGGAPFSAGGGAPVFTGSGAGGLPAAAGAGGTTVASGGGAAGALTLPNATNSDHCLNGYDPLPSDDTMKSGPALFTVGNDTDTIVQPEVLQWMTDNHWMGAHVVWHAVRGCVDKSAAGLLNPLGYPNICTDYPVLIPTDQNCKTAGDGYQFLLFHRHMLQSLKQLWPKHAADFDGFPKFPTTKEDVPENWRNNAKYYTWSQQVKDAANIADNIEKNLDKFPDEGSLGFWLQCPGGTQRPSSVSSSIPTYLGLHFDLHNEWSLGAATEHGLNNGQKNITNYMFWKLHGWIDNVWEKYRVAKGITTNPDLMQKYKQDIKQSCNEMGIEIEILKQTPGQGPKLDCPPDVDEKGGLPHEGAADLRVRLQPLRQLPRSVPVVALRGPHVGRPGLEQMHRAEAQEHVERRRAIPARGAGRSRAQLSVLEGLRVGGRGWLRRHERGPPVQHRHHAAGRGKP